MKRRDLLKGVAALGLMSAMPFSFAGERSGSSAGDGASDGSKGAESASRPRPLEPPARGSIPVAFLVSEGAVVIDFAGPWEVFQDVMVPGRSGAAFQLYTVGETTKPFRASGGLQIVPDYTLETAPAPRVIVIPAQSGESDAVLSWIRKSSKGADVTMSVCTGAALLAKTGLLSGKSATTHHSAYKELAALYPDIQVKRGARFVEVGNLATSGGLSSGIDLALRVVERYYGRDVAAKTAYEMEYQGEGWLNANSNEAYARIPTSSEKHPICAVCEMDVDPATALKSVYQDRTYLFCSKEHKEAFEAAPDKFANAAKGH